jgi:hypothetical protein
MSEEFLIQQRKRADAHLAEFLEATSGYSLDDPRPQWQKGTHLVTFGMCRGRPAVFKFYDGDPRKEHEKKALELFFPSGLVPEIYAETDLMLVMERLPGLTVEETREWDELNFSLGGAVARIVETAPGKDLAGPGAASFDGCDPRDSHDPSFDALGTLYREAGTAMFFDTTVGLSARVLRDKDVPHKETLAWHAVLGHDGRD